MAAGSVGETLPSQITLNGGVGTASVTLKAVNLTNQTRWYTASSTWGGTNANAINVWFQVIATREAYSTRATACGYHMQGADHFVALPYGLSLCGITVNLRASPVSASSVTAVQERGPWFPHSAPTEWNPCVGPPDPYWNTTGVPRAASAPCSSNGAGIDLAGGTYDDLGLAGNPVILWRFGQ